MAVLAEMYSVVVRVATLGVGYPGGVEAYKARCPNATFCSDGEVCRVGFMSWADVELFLRQLQPFNITLDSGAIAIVREDKGLLHESDWLEFQRIQGTPAARLAGSTVEFFVAPSGWEPGHQNVLMTEAELRDMELIASANGVDSYRDRSSGDVLHVGRARALGRKKPWWRFWN